jgi:predicted N-acetyltransferase YhbS
MTIKLVRASIQDAELIWKIQVDSFAELLKKYQDMETSPANEKVDKIEMRLNQSFTYYYLAYMNEETVGAIRVVDKKEENKNKRISPIFVLPQYRNLGIAQKMIQLVEEIHGKSGWELDTILQEPGNCYLYEKMGYCSTGKTKIVNDRLTLIYYEK